MDKLASKIQKEYLDKEEIIDKRINEFKELRNASNERLFLEMVFVILSSQSSAKKAWKAAKKLEKNKLILEGTKKDIENTLSAFEIQQEKRKAEYIVNNRESLSQPSLTQPDNKLKIKNKIYPENLEKSRKWLAENIEGLSWKGASHFLRNIGYGDNFAIISRHILKTLYEYNIRDDIEPPKNYEEYKKDEETIRKLADKAELDIIKLDLVLWSMKTGEVFK